MEYRWQKLAKKPSRTAGYLVIESDDGNLTDFLTWFPTLKRVSRGFSNFYPYNLAKACPNINAATIGTADKMSVSQLLELQRYGWEIMSHGKHHTGIGTHALTSAATAGATTIKIQEGLQIRPEGGYKYRIWEGSVEEEIIPLSVVNNVATLASPLLNSYSTAGKIHLTDAALVELLQGGKDLMESWGVDVQHHVYTYHAGSYHQYSQTSVNKVGELFVSGRGDIGLNKIGQSYKANLKARLNDASFDTDLEARLDEVVTNNGVLIYYGHGDKPEQLGRVAKRAIEKGIKIITRSEAIKILFP